MTVAPLPTRAATAAAIAPLLRLRDAVLHAPELARQRVEVACEGLSPLAWLSAAPPDARLAYFAGRDGDGAVLSVGTAELVTARNAARAPEGWRYLGAMPFDGTPAVEGFAAPLVELGREAGRSWAAAYLLGRSELVRRRVVALIDAMLARAESPASEQAPARVVTRVERPDRAGWERMMARTLAAIEADQVGKVVLARQVQLRLDAPVDPVAVLARLSRREPHSFRFLLRRGGATFVGASPERLFARRGRQVASEAVAGTRRRGRDDLADGRLAADLLGADKDLREHTFVADAVAAALRSVCGDVTADASPRVVATGTLLHLHTHASGALRPGFDDADLLAALHPTPAMCGWPTGAARELLREVEPFSRGPYAAPIGWIGGGRAELAVGIRAVELAGTRALLTAGAGVVRGSDPAAEWRETEAKLAGVLAAVTA